MAETASKSTGARKTPSRSKAVTKSAAGAASGADKRTEAKSRFNAALEEARAGATLLGEDARERAQVYRTQAKSKGDDWASEAKTKAGELAVEGKARASDALNSLGRVVDENAGVIDEKLGPKYGDYARSASKSLQNTAAKLDQKSVEELGEDARELVRKSPAAAVGLAALAGFLLARLFRR